MPVLFKSNMVGDDSSTDEEDSFYDIYSTEKVTSTYKNLLQKIKSTETSTRNDVRNDEDSEGNVIEDDPKEEIDGYVPSLRETQLEEELPDLIVLDDSAPFRPVQEEPSVRRSARLRNKNNTLNSRVRSKKKSKQRRGNEICDVIEIIDDEGKDGFDLYLDDELNYEVSVKVVWKSVSVKTFRLRRFQKLTQIFDHYTREENVLKEQILLYLKDRKISPNDTPESLNLKVCDFIEGGILSDSTHITEELVQNETCSNNKDCLLIKVQDVNKKCYKFSIGKNDYLKLIMMKYAEQIETPLNKIKFYFDGEILNPSCTPDSYGLENDEIIDVKIID